MTVDEHLYVTLDDDGEPAAAYHTKMQAERAVESNSYRHEHEVELVPDVPLLEHDEPDRCDGCGVAGYDLNDHRVTNSRFVSYCDQCDALREKYDIRNEDHEQYRLKELADELAASENEVFTDE